MTDKPNHKQIQQACDLLNGPNDATPWFPGHYGDCTVITALADTIAKLDAMQAERDKATADLGAIGEIAAMYGWGKPDADIGKKTVAAIAAPYQVETDPLVAAISAAIGEYIMPGAPWDKLRAELAKRGLEIERSA